MEDMLQWMSYRPFVSFVSGVGCVNEPAVKHCRCREVPQREGRVSVLALLDALAEDCHCAVLTHACNKQVSAQQMPDM